MKHPHVGSEYSVGDVVPYINTRSQIVECKITSFHDVGNGKIWLRGFDTKTLADVHYPVWKSLKLKKTSKEVVK